MKKVMFMIVGVLFAVSVNAASLTITETTGTFGGSINGNGTDEVHVVSEQIRNTSIEHIFRVENTGATTASAFRLWVSGDANAASNIDNFSVTVDGFEIATLLTAYNIYGVGVYNSLLIAAGDFVTVVVKGDFTNSASYDLTLATPIPAALFLFAPALLGFFGLRRKAAVAA